MTSETSRLGPVAAKLTVATSRPSELNSAKNWGLGRGRHVKILATRRSRPERGMSQLPSRYPCSSIKAVQCDGNARAIAIHGHPLQSRGCVDHFRVVKEHCAGRAGSRRSLELASPSCPRPASGRTGDLIPSATTLPSPLNAIAIECGRNILFGNRRGSCGASGRSGCRRREDCVNGVVQVAHRGSRARLPSGLKA